MISVSLQQHDWPLSAGHLATPHETWLWALGNLSDVATQIGKDPVVDRGEVDLIKAAEIPRDFWRKHGIQRRINFW